MMAVASFQIMSAALFFILFHRASLWAQHAYRYHNEERCGHRLIAMSDRLQAMDDDHPQLVEGKRRYGDEVRNCMHRPRAYFENEFYSECMPEGARVLKWNPSVSAVVIGVIVWLLQRGPLNYGTFKKPSFLVSLFAILILISVNFADFITGFINVSHKTLTSYENDFALQCGHAPAIMAMLASSGCLLSSISVGCFIVLIYMTRIEKLDLQIKELKDPSAPSSKDEAAIPIAGGKIKPKKTKFHDANEHLVQNNGWNQ